MVGGLARAVSSQLRADGDDHVELSCDGRAIVVCASGMDIMRCTMA